MGVRRLLSKLGLSVLVIVTVLSVSPAQQNAEQTQEVSSKPLVWPGPATVQVKSSSVYRGHKVTWLSTKRDDPAPGELSFQMRGHGRTLRDLFSDFTLQLQGEAKPRKLEVVRMIDGPLSEILYVVLRVRYGRNAVVFAVDMSNGEWVREKVYHTDPMGVKRAREEFEPHLILDKKVGPVRVEWAK